MSELRKFAQRALDAHRADIRREVQLTGEPAEGGAGCWCHDLARALDSEPAAHAEMPDSLDAAWAEAEAALPEGWWIDLEGPFAETPRRHVAKAIHVVGMAAPAGVPWSYGPTPAAALRALAAELREAAG